MSKKSKRKRKSNPSNAQQEIGEKDMQNTDVKIHGAVEVHPSQDSITLHSAERQEDARQKSEEHSLSRWTFRVAAAALAISTLYSVFTLLIFLQTKKTADANIKTVKILQAQQRPWLWLTLECIIQTSRFNAYNRSSGCVPEPREVLDNPGPITIQLNVFNHGNSPALNSRLEAHWCVSGRTNDVPPTLDECKKSVQHDEIGEEGPYPLIPKAASNAGLEVIKEIPRWNPEWLKGPDNSAKYFYIIGRAEYDEFQSAGKSVTHWSEFCVYYSPHAGIPALNCKGGNHVDSN